VATKANRPSTIVQAVVPPSLAEQLRSRAHDERRSVSQVIRFAIEDSLRRRDHGGRP
jgi:Arc/MetJ-type ribon-helix-helix transcriptional regulator